MVDYLTIVYIEQLAKIEVKTVILRVALNLLKKCSLLNKPPYVCNGCKRRTQYTLSKHIYDARYAYEEYKNTLKATYECYQGLINSLKERNFNKFKAITFNPNNNISLKMKQALKLYKENIQYIENSFKYDINNGVIEGTNNLI